MLPDKEFRRVGDASRVDYAQEYRAFKQFIALKADTPAMRRTITFFNTEVFVGIRGGAGTKEDVAEDFSDQLAAAMAQFGFGDDDDGDFDDDGTASTDTPQQQPRVVIPDKEHAPATSNPSNQRNATAGPSRPLAAARPITTPDAHSLEPTEADTDGDHKSAVRKTRAGTGQAGKTRAAGRQRGKGKKKAVD